MRSMKSGAGEVPLLEDDAMARVLQDLADDAGDVGIRARPRNEEIGFRSRGFLLTHFIQWVGSL